jgi:hypothetical protein
MATTETFVSGRLYEMPLAKLQHDPNQPRKYIDPATLDELKTRSARTSPQSRRPRPSTACTGAAAVGLFYISQ